MDWSSVAAAAIAAGATLAATGLTLLLSGQREIRREEVRASTEAELGWLLERHKVYSRILDLAVDWHSRVLQLAEGEDVDISDIDDFNVKIHAAAADAEIINSINVAGATLDWLHAINIAVNDIANASEEYRADLTASISEQRQRCMKYMKNDLKLTRLSPPPWER